MSLGVSSLWLSLAPSHAHYVTPSSVSIAAVFGRLTSDPSSSQALELCSPTGSHHTHTHAQPLRLVFQHLSTTQSLSLHTERSIRSSVPPHLCLLLAEWDKASVLVPSHPLSSSTRLASACVGVILNKLLWSTWNHKTVPWIKFHS